MRFKRAHDALRGIENAVSPGREKILPGTNQIIAIGKEYEPAIGTIDLLGDMQRLIGKLRGPFCGETSFFARTMIRQNRWYLVAELIAWRLYSRRFFIGCNQSLMNGPDK